LKFQGSFFVTKVKGRVIGTTDSRNER